MSDSRDTSSPDPAPALAGATPKPVALPRGLAGSGTLDRLVDTAREYARQATAENTNKSYAKDWAHFAGWCRRRGTTPVPPIPELIGL